MPNTPNTGTVVAELNKLVAEIGLEKLSADGGKPEESAGVVADKGGTTQPAKQEASRSNIQPATAGSHGSELSQQVKEEVRGQNVEEAKPKDAENAKGSKSDVDNITTATTVGEDASVEKKYGDKKSTGNYTSTTHPADVNKEKEKYSAAQLVESADAVLHELALSKQASIDDLTMDNAMEKLGELLVTVNPNLEKTAEVKKQAAEEAVTKFLKTAIKSAGLMGNLTADYFDGKNLAKKAEDTAEEANGGKEPVKKADDMEVAEGGEGGGDVDEAATQAVLEQAAQIADATGTTVEDVLEAALAEEMEGGGGEEGMEGAEGISEEELMNAIAEEAAAQGSAGGESGVAGPAPMEAMASVNELQEKAAKYDKLAAELAEKEAQDKNRQTLQEVIQSTMESWWQKKAAELQQQKA